MEPFAIGDVVRLQSGGPKMTVHWIDLYGQHWCRWFDKGDQARQRPFKLATLVKAED